MPLKLKSLSGSPLPPFTFTPSPPPPPMTSSPPRPPADLLPMRDMPMFGSQPLKSQTSDPSRQLRACDRCQKVVMAWSMGEHQKRCAHILDGAPLGVKVKSEKATKGEKKRRASEDSDISPPKKRAKIPLGEIPPAGNPEYKGLKKSEIKRLKKEKEKAAKRAAKEQEKAAIAERKRMRASEPINLDKQCGVINDRNVPCSRSLTCKTHTVGAKRAVEGRSQPYDVLYLEWQRVHRPDKVPPPKPAKKPKVVERPVIEDLNEGIKDDEAGRREMSELIGLAGMSFRRLGSGVSTTWAGNAQKSGQKQANGITSGAAATASNAVASGPAKTTWLGGQVEGIWRTAMDIYASAQVGEMFIKALAARKRPDGQNVIFQGQAAQAAQAALAAAGSVGGPPGTATLTVGPAVDGGLPKIQITGAAIQA